MSERGIDTPYWVYGQCGDGHDPQTEGEGICWARCRRCGHIAYTPEHEAEAAWLDAQERARELAEKERTA